MPDEKTVYAYHGREYEALIAREDHLGHLLRALQEVVPPAGRIVLDLGAGTGRLARLLAPQVKRVHALDISLEMLRVCRRELAASGLKNWQVSLADHRYLPIPARSADLLVSGWSVSYLAVWHPESPRDELEKWLVEAKRVLSPGGFIVLFESLGTGNESPVRLPHLEPYYPWLDEVGFQNKWIRTDYSFESLDEAEYLARFFFGDDLGDKVRQNRWVILPECTGVWWLSV
jgi:ubiquinone/menaquinone biosynthesis C-methylase UbiE